MHIEAHHIAAHLHSNAGRKTLLAADFINPSLSPSVPSSDVVLLGAFSMELHSLVGHQKHPERKKKVKKKLSWERLSPFEVR